MATKSKSYGDVIIELPAGATRTKSGAGHGPGPEYGVVYEVPGGKFVCGTAHADRGNLVTDKRIMTRRQMERATAEVLHWGGPYVQWPWN